MLLKYWYDSTQLCHATLDCENWITHWEIFRGGQIDLESIFGLYLVDIWGEDMLHSQLIEKLLNILRRGNSGSSYIYNSFSQHTSVTCSVWPLGECGEYVVVCEVVECKSLIYVPMSPRHIWLLLSSITRFSRFSRVVCSGMIVIFLCKYV